MWVQTRNPCQQQFMDVFRTAPNLSKVEFRGIPAGGRPWNEVIGFLVKCLTERTSWRGASLRLPMEDRHTCRLLQGNKRHRNESNVAQHSHHCSKVLLRSTSCAFPCGTWWMVMNV